MLPRVLAGSLGMLVGCRAHEWRCDAGGQKNTRSPWKGSRFLAIPRIGW